MLSKLRNKTTQKQFIQIIITIVTLTALALVGLLTGCVIFYSGSFKPILAIPKGAVVSRNSKCSEIGTTIMKNGGNTVDSAIAILLCEGIYSPSTIEFSRPFIMTIYKKSNQQVYTLNSPSTVSKGNLSISIPGELRGYWMAYQRFGGGLPWKDLLEPIIEICKNGIPISDYLERTLKMNKENLYSDPVLRNIFFDNKRNNTLKAGQYFKRPRLANVLEMVAVKGINAFYDETLTKEFIENRKNIITAEELKNYKVDWQIPYQIDLSGNLKFISFPSPASGGLLSFILNILDGFLDTDHSYSITNAQRIIESFKFAYGKMGELEQTAAENITDFIDKILSQEYSKHIRQLISDNSTSQNISYYGKVNAEYKKYKKEVDAIHINIFGYNGDAVAVTTVAGSLNGANFASHSTGIILDKETNMDSTFLISPSIVLNENDTVVLVIGGTGGLKNIASVAQVMINHLWYKMDIDKSLSAKRFRHQLLPMEVELEQEFKTQEKELVDGLSKIGHKLSYSSDNNFAAVSAISISPMGIITGASDPRQPGEVSYVH